MIEKFNTTLNRNFKYLKLQKYNNIFVASDLSKLGKLRLKKNDLLENIYTSIKNVTNKPSTIFVPTGSLSHCNSSKIFDLKDSPSEDMGAFSEYIRKKKNSIRSLHPLWSVSGNGKNAKSLENVSKHAYGIESPWSKMLDLDTLQINIGKHPSRAVTLIHHIETIFGVPYRYNKQFLNKIKINNKIIISDFYMSVFFKNIGIQKKIRLNEHFFEKLKKKKRLNYIKNKFGLEIWSFRMRDFYSVAIQEMKLNIFNYLEKEPKFDLLKKY